MPKKLSAETARATIANARPLSEIAKEISSDWRHVFYGAVPYLEAMRVLDRITDDYMHDSAESIVLYFLSNAFTWRGETARRVKLELADILRASEFLYGVAHASRD